VVVLAGNFGEYSENQLEKLVDKYFKFENGPVEKTLPALLNEKKGYFLEDRKTEQTHLVIGFKTVSINHPDFFALDLLSVVLGGSMSSRMFSEVREKRGLAYSVKSDTDDYSESGAIMTQAGVGHDKLYEATRAILGEYKKIKQKLISKEELAKVKEIVLGKMLIRIEDSEEIAFHYACETLLAEKILTHTDLRKIYQRITADDIMRVAKKYLVPEKIGIAVIGPKLQKQKIINLIDSFK